MSKALPVQYYRDPLRIVLAEEGRSCKGCIHRDIAWDVQYCKKHEKRSGGNMRRCKDYREGV